MLALCSASRAATETHAGRFASPAVVAGAVAFMLSPAAAYVTGAVIPVDVGLTAMMGVGR